jgi:hypothetical protein
MLACLFFLFFGCLCSDPFDLLLPGAACGPVCGPALCQQVYHMASFPYDFVLYGNWNSHDHEVLCYLRRLTAHGAVELYAALHVLCHDVQASEVMYEGAHASCSSDCVCAIAPSLAQLHLVGKMANNKTCTRDFFDFLGQVRWF